MEIPWQRLNQETLRRVIEEFVTREGTEYGQGDVSLDQKVEQVMLQLRRKQAVLCFDPDSESCHILPTSHFVRDRQGARSSRSVEAFEDLP